MSPPPAMRFFVDHCVPESVPRMLEDKGYEVIRLREKTPADSTDHLVAAVAEANDAVLVTIDADFRQIASRTGIGRRRFKTLSLIRFEQCRGSQAAGRLEAALIADRARMADRHGLGGSANVRGHQGGVDPDAQVGEVAWSTLPSEASNTGCCRATHCRD